MKKRKIATPSNWKQLSYHPFSELTEFGVGIDMEQLVGRMQRTGFKKDEPIILYHGGILCGRHRHSAAMTAEIEPLFVEFIGTDSEALEEVKSQLNRQSLTPSQLAMVAVKYATLEHGQRADLQACNSGEEATTQQEAADSLNVSKRSVNHAKKVEDGCIDSIKRGVRVGLIAVSDASYAADYTEAQQERAFRDVQAKEFKTLKAALPARKDKEGKKKSKKATPKTGMEGLPKSVQTAMTDTWHLDSARTLARLRKQAKGVLSWSVWLALDDLDAALQTAEQCLLSAAPTKLCPECEGKKKIEKETCVNCRGGGFLGAQAC